MRRLAALLALVGLLAGCASAPGADRGLATPSPTTAPATPQPEDDGPPLALIGLWRVTDAGGESARTWLRLSDDEALLWRPCGFLFVSWDATPTLFLASLAGGESSCYGNRHAKPAPWLDAAHRYRRAGAGWDLLDASGAIVAHLAVNGHPKRSPNALPSAARPPVITDATRAMLAPRPPLPSSLAAPSSSDLAGRWIPVGHRLKTDPFVRFRTDGAWKASDGCNGIAGHWTVDGRGALLTTAGAMSLVGCEGAPIPSDVATARLAGLRGSQLVLVGRRGETTTLRRDPRG